MSAQVLRTAAALMREDHPINELGGEFWDAVADWLEEEAREVEQDYPAAPEQHHRRALAVALAYLGEEA